MSTDEKTAPGFRFQVLGVMSWFWGVQVSGPMVQGVGFRVQGLGFGV